ncbi:hypothetical protein B0G80_5466 [Paraburkholderia sp. BL6669N2]|nr:hypothetical protein B0G80_5466 [Paraburkholderia sp. BL6669N2]
MRWGEGRGQAMRNISQDTITQASLRRWKKARLLMLSLVCVRHSHDFALN